MKFPLFLLLGALSLAASVLAKAAESRPAAEWADIIYPGIKPPCLPGHRLELRIERDPSPPQPGVFSTGPGLKCILQWNGDNGGDGGKIFETGYMKMRLHYPDGSVVESRYESGFTVFTSGSGPYFQKYFSFPFGKNALEEAWLELAMDGRSDWFEIPYGLTRPPDMPLPSSDPQAPSQATAPAMRKGTPKDDITRWDAVRYRARTIQNGWNLEVDMVHRGDIRCRVRLRRDSGRWDIPTPVTRVRLEKDGGGTLRPDQISSRLPEPFHNPGVREDEFTFGYDCTLGGRLWGDLIVTVDDQPQSFTIPLGFFIVGIWNTPWEH